MRTKVENPKKRNAVPKAWYPESVKQEALRLWLITGNLKATAAAMNIPHPTLQSWRYSEWWEEMANDIRAEGKIQLSNKMRSIAERAMEVTLDRLENGDWIYDQKKGEMVRKPVVMRDAHRVAESFVDRAVKLDQRPADEAQTKKVEDRLAALAATFASFSKKVRRIEVEDAIYDERQEGLPEGSELGEDEEAETLEGSCEEGPSEACGGEGDWESEDESACGPCEDPEFGGFELPEQPPSHLSEVKPDQGSQP